MSPCVPPGEFVHVTGESGSRQFDAVQAPSGASRPGSGWQVAGASRMDPLSRLPL
jgi:hypothetical protein